MSEKHEAMSPMQNGQAWGIVFKDGEFRIVPGGLKRVELTKIDTPSGYQEEMVEEVSHFVKKPKIMQEEILFMEVEYEDTEHGEGSVSGSCDMSFLPLGSVTDLRDVLVEDEQKEFVVSYDKVRSLAHELAQEQALFPDDPQVLALLSDKRYFFPSLAPSSDSFPRELWENFPYASDDEISV